MSPTLCAYHRRSAHTADALRMSRVTDGLPPLCAPQAEPRKPGSTAAERLREGSTTKLRPLRNSCAAEITREGFVEAEGLLTPALCSEVGCLESSPPLPKPLTLIRP